MRLGLLGGRRAAGEAHRRLAGAPPYPVRRDAAPEAGQLREPEAFADEFLAYQATVNKPSELASKKGSLRVHLIPAFGKYRLDQIDERMIDAYKVEKLSYLSARGKPLNPKTINNHLKVLGRMLRVARKWKLLEDIPEIGLLEVRKSDFDFLEFEEAETFIAGTAASS